jgi:RNA polymerase sigma-70 factor (ECF subfamily)
MMVMGRGDERQAALAAARQAHPDIVVDDAVFFAGVGDRALDTLDAAEVYLACACERGDAAAIGKFEVAYFGVIDAALAPMKLPDGMADEVRQIVRTKLFVGEDADGPKVAKYAGQGTLGGLVRVIAVRTALGMLRKTKKEQPLGSSAVADELMAVSVAPELQIVKQKYKSHFKEAFEAAIEELSARDRTVLKLHVIDRLSIDEIGTLYKVHRATAARWLETIRDQLGDRTRVLMSEKLAIGGTDLESVIHVIQSQVTMTLSRILG